MNPNSELFKKIYNEIDLSVFNNIFTHLFETLSKNSVDSSAPTLNIVTSHLQLVEILCLHIFAVKENNIMHLFLANQPLREKIESDMFKSKNIINKRYFEEFLKKYIFNKNLDTPFTTSEQETLQDQLRVIGHALKLYIKNFQLLNSYKHGFRLGSKGGETDLAIGNNKDNLILLDKYNTTITFFSKSKDCIEENVLCLNWQPLVIDAAIIINVIELMIDRHLSALDPKRNLQKTNIYKILNKELYKPELRNSSKFKCFYSLGTNLSSHN